MTAKEMFEELGYELIRKDESLIHYYNKSIWGNLEVKFWEADNVVYHNIIRDDIVVKGSSAITIPLLKAIQKQIEELGWEVK